MTKGVVITGLGVVSSLGTNINEFWGNILKQVSGVQLINSFDVGNLPTKIGAEIGRSWLYEGNPLPKNSQRMSKVTLFALLATRQALAQAQLNAHEFGTLGGVLIGCSQGGFVESEYFFKIFFDEGKTSPLSILKPMNSSPSSYISIENGIKGPILTIDNACSSANHAIGIARNMIEAGQIEFAIVGGTDTVFSPAVFSNWCALRVMSTQNQIPQKACKPFSMNRDGTVLGEGAGILILESTRFAKARGAKPLAKVIGYGSSADSLHIVNQNVEGQIMALKYALDDAGISTAEIDYISAHATGTKINDSTETEAIKRVFGKQAYKVPISGIKPAIGHTLAASAALEAIACVLSMNSGYIPATLNYEQIDPDCDLDYVIEGSRKTDPNVCVSNSFGFGGSNGVIVLSKID